MATGITVAPTGSRMRIGGDHQGVDHRDPGQVVAEPGARGPGQLGHPAGVAVVLARRGSQDERAGPAGDQSVTAELSHGPVGGQRGQDRVEAVRLERGGVHVPPSAPTPRP